MMVLLLLGCRPPDGVQVVATIPSQAPLAARVEVTSDRPVAPLEIVVDGRSQVLEPVPHAQQHELIAVGLEPGRAQNLRVLLGRADGSTFSTQAVTVSPPPLPETFPTIEAVTKSEESGYLVSSLSLWEMPDDLPQDSFVLVTDLEGKVLWYYRDSTLFNEIVPLANGNLLMLELGPMRLVERDLLGREVRTLRATGLGELQDGETAVEVDSFHHDFDLAPDGAIWALSSQLSDGVVDDRVVLVSPEGRVAKDYSLRSVLDPGRSLYPDTGFWEHWYEPPALDWGHANSLNFSPDRSRFLVSLRNQDAVVCLEATSGRPLWIVSRPEGWNPSFNNLRLQPDGKLQWPVRQHAAKWTGPNSFVLFDNGQEASRAVEYTVGPDTRKVRQSWEFRDQPPFHSPFLCDVDPLPDGAVVITDGCRKDEDGRFFARLLEVGRDGHKRFELLFRRPAAAGCTIYRTHKLSHWP